jgi:hypothetical protein
MEYLSSIVATTPLRRDGMAGNTASNQIANPLSYPKSAQPFSSKLFQNPTSEYRGCPLWAWNTKLQKEQLLRQIDTFQTMGMGGFQ